MCLEADKKRWPCQDMYQDTSYSLETFERVNKNQKSTKSTDDLCRTPETLVFQALFEVEGHSVIL